MPSTLRSGLWDAVRLHFFTSIYSGYGNVTQEFENISDLIWFHFYREPMDDKPENGETALSTIRSKFMAASFSQVYSFLEFMANIDNHISTMASRVRQFATFCNSVLERERSMFRFAGATLVQLSDEQALSEVAKALSQNDAIGVQKHVKRAAELYSQTDAPDYRNSVKESISAVEAAVAFVTGQKASGVSKPLRSATERLVVHPALRDGFEKLYAYTSDEGGIRHAIMNEENITQADARYMLVSCSAFANYLIALRIQQP